MLEPGADGLVYCAFRQVGLKCGTSAGSISNASCRWRISPLRTLTFFEPEQADQSAAAEIAKTTLSAITNSQLILIQSYPLRGCGIDRPMVPIA